MKQMRTSPNADSKLNEHAYSQSYIKNCVLQSECSLESKTITSESIFKLSPLCRYPKSVQLRPHDTSKRANFASLSERVETFRTNAQKAMDTVKCADNSQLKHELLNYLFESLIKNSGSYKSMLCDIKREYATFVRAQLNVFDEASALRNKIARLKVGDGNPLLSKALGERIILLKSLLNAEARAKGKLELALAQEDSRFVLALGDLHTYNVKDKLECANAAQSCALDAAKAMVSHMIDPQEKYEFVKGWLTGNYSSHPGLKTILNSVQQHQAEYKVLLSSNKEDYLQVHSILLDPETSKQASFSDFLSL